MTIAWLFPGQGAQKIGMGEDVFGASAAAKKVFERADAALGEPLSQLCFKGPMEQLTLTANTQPALVATSAALLAAAQERYPELAEPRFSAGHSLGEYSALYAAGVLSLEDAVKTARARGEAMQSAVAPGVGAMAAIIGQPNDALESLCEEVRAATGEVVSPANFNAHGQTVIAGHAGAVGQVVQRVKAAGGKAIPLKVSAPFHCSLMAPATAPLATALQHAKLQDARFDVLANVDAKPHRGASEIHAALLAQVDHTVQWVATIEAMRAAGVERAIEFGPGKVLAGLCRRIDKGLRVFSVNSLATLEKLGAFLTDES